MSQGERTLATLAAAFAAERAVALMARLAAPPDDAVGLAAHLAGASRRERLEALATVTALDPTIVLGRAEAAAALERPRIARLLRATAAGAPAGPSCAPSLARIVRELLSR